MKPKESEMNLLKSPWIRALVGEAVSPKAIIDIGDASIEDIVTCRADFRGAIYQLLIGLVQTAFAPKGRKEWLKYWREPPGKEELNEAFKPYRSAFEIDAPIGSPSFMQDLELNEGEKKDIAALLIEAPGGKTIKDNQDHFIKRGRVQNMSPWSAALSLFTLQINAPSGGVGHRVSLRGGGPLTTLILPPEKEEYNTLWHRLWLNVLTQDEIDRLPGNPELTELEAILPWMGKTRTSEKKGMETYPEHAHPLQIFWSMPRRMRLHFSGEEGICDLTGEPTDNAVHSFQTKNYGTNYSGNWVHPLTPYVFEPNKEPLSIKAQPGGLGYRHWLGLVVEGRKGKLTRSPAGVVQRYYKERSQWIGDAEFHPRLWAFGYDMDNMKARCWYEAIMPVFNLKPEQRDDIADNAQKMIEAAADTLKTLKISLKKAWFKRPADAKGDISFIDANFWSATEPVFYSLLRDLVSNLENENSIDELLGQWRNTLKQTAHKLFDQYALSSLNEDGDLKRIVMAREGKGGLQHYLNGSKALKALAA
ncbi:MAG TPA: type I-E CRISPR-associated protein Cse1/CasA [Chromatiaceae bacterium]|nr:type I-E CRISPR-associated protein Cse1/CasA [Chromatiaceae bacterium]